MTDWQDAFARLQDIYADVSEEVQVLEKRHADRLHCGLGCTECCVDEITVFEIEAEHIRQNAGEVLAQQPHPVGQCAFLDTDGACRIYDFRPYVCRTQGLPLRWLDEDAQGQMAEFRDICPLNEVGEPLEILPADVCWELGPVEGRLATLQAGIDDWNMTRIALRDLFGEKTSDG